MAVFNFTLHTVTKSALTGFCKTITQIYEHIVLQNSLFSTKPSAYLLVHCLLFHEKCGQNDL